jgi:hypothetical protein
MFDEYRAVISDALVELKRLADFRVWIYRDAKFSVAEQEAVNEAVQVYLLQHLAAIERAFAESVLYEVGVSKDDGDLWRDSIVSRVRLLSRVGSLRRGVKMHFTDVCEYWEKQKGLLDEFAKGLVAVIAVDEGYENRKAVRTAGIKAMEDTRKEISNGIEGQITDSKSAQ